MTTVRLYLSTFIAFTVFSVLSPIVQADSPWSEPLSLTDKYGITADGANRVVPVISDDGALVLIWHDNSDYPYVDRLKLVVRSSNGQWSSSDNVPSGPGRLASPAFLSAAAYSQGVLHIFFVQDNETWYVRRNREGLWSSPTEFPIRVNTILPLSDTSIRVFGWIEHDYGVGVSVIRPEGSWSQPTGPELPEDNIYSYSIDWTPSLLGQIHLVWENQHNDKSEVFYSRFTYNGGWSVPINVSQNLTNSRLPRVSADQSGSVHIVWCDQTSAETEGVFYRSFSDGKLSPTSVIGRLSRCQSSQIQKSSDDVLHVGIGVEQALPNGQFHLATRSPNDSWTYRIIVLSDSRGYPFWLSSLGYVFSVSGFSTARWPETSNQAFRVFVESKGWATAMPIGPGNSFVYAISTSERTIHAILQRADGRAFLYTQASIDDLMVFPEAYVPFVGSSRTSMK